MMNRFQVMLSIPTCVPSTRSAKKIKPPVPPRFSSAGWTDKDAYAAEIDRLRTGGSAGKYQVGAAGHGAPGSPIPEKKKGTCVVM